MPLRGSIFNYSSKSILGRLKKMGLPDETASDIEREFKSPRYKDKRKWTVTENYLIYNGLFHFAVLRFEKLLWAYNQITRYSTNLVPVGKSYASWFVTSDGGATIITTKECADYLLSFAAKRAPWAWIGYTSDLKNWLEDDPIGFYASVEKKKQDLLRATKS